MRRHRLAFPALLLWVGVSASACSDSGNSTAQAEGTATSQNTATVKNTATTKPSNMAQATTGMASTAGSPSAQSSASASPTSSGVPQVSNGPGPKLGPCAVFPADNPWNQDVSALPLHAKSQAYVSSVGMDAKMHPDFGTEWEGAPIGIPYVLVPGNQKRVNVEFDYSDESDPGPYPIPADAPIEGGPDSDGDRHVLVVDTDECMLYETWASYKAGDAWSAGSGAIFDLKSNALRTEGWTSADAAGLPILPGLVRYDEVMAGEIQHALRFTIVRSQKAHIHPATHSASDKTDSNLPPMGARFRMKASYDCTKYSTETQVVCAALKRYGMFMADNGSNWYLSGVPDQRWDDDALNDIKKIAGSAFEVVETGPVITD